MTDSEIMSCLGNLKNVCRLCSTKMDIVSIFHKKFDFPQKMEAIVLTLTTVVVTKQDEISQNICAKCVAVVVKMFQFRDQAIRNDQRLKAQYERLKKALNKSDEKDNETDTEPIVEVSTEPPKVKRELNGTEVVPVEINKEEKMESKDKIPVEKRDSNLTVDNQPTESKPKVSQRTKLNYKAHPSIGSLFRQYPNIRLPAKCVSSNVEPTVVMEMDAVENYFKSKKLNMYKYIQLALNQPRKVAVKHTLSNNQFEHLQNFERQESIWENNKLGQGIGIKRKFSEDDSPDLSVASSQMLHICGVCSSVHSRAWHLARHMTKHLNCQFCKSKFKTLEIKQKHVESECKIQKIMKSMIHLPEIPLQKIELDAEVTRKFHETFDYFGLITKIETSNKDVIIPTINNINPTINIDISIKNHSGLNSLLLNKSTDIKLIKNLLVQYNKQHRKFNNASQTFLPTNELIKVNYSDMTINLKSLKQHLSYYKIPIEVKNGSTNNVCYKYDSSDKTGRELKDWDHLTPIDVNFSTGKSILNRFDPLLADKEIKQELINMEDSKMEEISIEDTFNLSLPVLKNVNGKRYGKSLSGFESRRVTKESTLDGKVSNMEVPSTSDNQQIYADAYIDCLNTGFDSENVVTIQDEILSPSTNEGVCYSEEIPSDISVVEDVDINPGTIRVKTVCEINK